MGILMNGPSKRSPFRDFGEPDAFSNWMRWAIAAAGAFCVVGTILCFCMEGCGKGGANAKKPPAKEKPAAAQAKAPDLKAPVRPAPASFPPNSNMPRGRETLSSGAIDLAAFDQKRDLVRFYDPRVWFNSDSKPDSREHEDDHLINRAMEIPLKRLVNLLSAKGGKLKIHDAFRPADKNKIHLAASLHCEGRAIDLTSENASLEELAKLCWQSGFDFVLYETPRNSGAHVHCSVARGPEQLAPPPKAK